MPKSNGTPNYWHAG